MQIKLMLLVLCRLSCSFCFAQIENVPGNANQVLRVTSKPVEVESVFLFSDWYDGVISSFKNSIIQQVKLRYNLVSDRVEVQSNNGSIELHPSQINSFGMYVKEGKSEVVKIRFFKNGFTEIPNYDPLNYFEVLFDAENSVFLLKKTEIKLVESLQVSYGKQSVSKESKQVITYFLITPEKKVFMVRPNKSFLGVLDGIDTEIRSALRSANVKIKNEEDMVTALSHCKEILGRK